MTDDYKEKMEAGLLYQDRVMLALQRDYGISLQFFCSRQYQIARGESMQGIEIKYDRKWRETGNLYIECAEKSKAENSKYVPSGILRRDNTRLWIVGDEQRAWVIAKKHLIAEKGLLKKVTTPTSVGVLLPIARADELCAWTMTIEDPAKGISPAVPSIQ